MRALVQLLTEKKLTISSIESLTAGLFSAKLAEVEHASAVLYGGLVTYDTNCKIDVLHVDKDLIDKHGVVSCECAEAMCLKGRELFNTDICVSMSGNAGPDVLDNKAVGQVYMGINYRGKIYLYDKIFDGSRNEIRNKTVMFLCEEIKKII